MTIQAATAVPHSIQITREVGNPNGPISIQIHGTARASDGGIEHGSVVNAQVRAALETNLRQLLDSPAVAMMLRNAMGLEAP